MPLFAASRLRGCANAGSLPTVLRHPIVAAGLLALSVAVVVYNEHRQRHSALLELNTGASGLDVLMQQARHIEQQQVMSLRHALALAEGVRVPEQSDLPPALADGQRLLEEELTKKQPAVGRQNAQVAQKMAALNLKKQAAKMDIARQRALESKLVAEMAIATTNSVAPAQQRTNAEVISVANSISDSIASLSGQFKNLQGDTTTRATAATSRAATTENEALAAEQQQQREQKALAVMQQQAIDAVAAGAPISQSLARSDPTLTPLVGVNTNNMLPRQSHPTAALAHASASSALAVATAAVGSAADSAVQNLAEAEMSLSKSLAAIAKSGKLQDMQKAASGLAGVGAAVAGAAEMGAVKGAASNNAFKVPVVQVLKETFKSRRAHLADVQLGEDIARLSVDAGGPVGGELKGLLHNKLSTLRRRLQMLGFSPENAVTVGAADSSQEEEQKRQTEERRRRRQAAQRSTSTYRYTRTAAELREQRNLQNRLRRIDPHFGEMDRNEFRVVPQRMPHKDSADLGDNYIGGDEVVSAVNRRMQQPSEFGTFLGTPHQLPRPGFMSPLTPRLKKAFEKKRNLNYANPELKFGNEFPVTPKLKKLLFGNAYPYARNKYGAMTDIFPSTRQYKAQITGRDRFAKDNTQRAMMSSKWPKTWKYTYRWRRACEHTPNFESVPCPWKWALENRKKACKLPLCTALRQGHWNHKVEDPLEKQLLEGAVNGRADPFGFAQELGDSREAADTVEEDARIRAHLRQPSGEPMGDAILRGWQMTNGIAWRAPDPVDEEEKEEETADENEAEDEDGEEEAAEK